MFCCTWAVGCWKFVQYIRMLCTGRFILVESVYMILKNCNFSFFRGLLQNFLSFLFIEFTLNDFSVKEASKRNILHSTNNHLKIAQNVNDLLWQTGRKPFIFISHCLNYYFDSYQKKMSNQLKSLAKNQAFKSDFRLRWKTARDFCEDNLSF